MKDMDDNKKNAVNTVNNHDRSQVTPMPLKESELNWIVKEAVKRLAEVKRENGLDVESATFNLTWKNGKTYKHKVYVAKDSEQSELTIDIAIYAPEVKGWEPQASYVIGIEEYQDGTWLPYWETLNGDCSDRRLRVMWQKIQPLWVKLGYLAGEDDERPY